MAIVTKRYLQEMVSSILSGGNPSQGQKYPPQMVDAFIQAAINRRLRSEYFASTLPSGETLPQGLSLACYDNIPVEKYKGVSRAKLPAAPVHLMRNMGVFFVGPAIAQGSGGGVTGDEVTYLIIEGVVGGTMRILGTEEPVTGIADGSTSVNCSDFVGKLVRVVRGSLPVPGIDTGDGGLYYTKNKVNDFVAFNHPLATGEYIRIEGFLPIMPVMPDYVIIEARIGHNTLQEGLQDAVTGLSDGSSVITCDAFRDRLVDVTRGTLVLPGADPGDGGMFFTKALADNFVTLSAPLSDNEYLKIETL